MQFINMFCVLDKNKRYK